ncbi:hypothetical protein [Desulfitobacterium sp. PCE1]|uniref:hypothetical protein n=1 Tax=Desulfitobacterium sp. PCE1 TaxID=146907 RepID=UPI0003790B5E|nr:hypothetical protein [Desulfitobacterium sp. PCE1]
MNETKEKIQRSSRTVSIGLQVLLALLILQVVSTLIRNKVVFSSTFLMIVIIHLAVVILAISIFKTIEKNNSPFINSIPKRMKAIALLIFIVSLFLSPGYGLINVFSLRFLSFENFIGIIIAGVFYSFAIMFEYGCLLQKESDETL